MKLDQEDDDADDLEMMLTLHEILPPPLKLSAVVVAEMEAKSQPKMLSAPVDRVTVRVVTGLRCPCGRQIHPYDVQYDRGGLILICARCHHDVIVIEP